MFCCMLHFLHVFFEVKGGAVDSLVSDHRMRAVELLQSATDVIVVLDNHGLEAGASLRF